VQGFGSYWFKNHASIDFILVEGFDYSSKYHKKRGVFGRGYASSGLLLQVFLLQPKET